MGVCAAASSASARHIWPCIGPDEERRDGQATFEKLLLALYKSDLCHGHCAVTFRYPIQVDMTNARRTRRKTDAISTDADTRALHCALEFAQGPQRCTEPYIRNDLYTPIWTVGLFY